MQWLFTRTCTSPSESTVFARWRNISAEFEMRIFMSTFQTNINNSESGYAH